MTDRVEFARKRLTIALVLAGSLLKSCWAAEDAGVGRVRVTPSSDSLQRPP